MPHYHVLLNVPGIRVGCEIVRISGVDGGKDILRHSDVRLTTQTYTDPSQMPTREAINNLPWVSCTHIRTQISDAEGQKLSQTVIVKTRQDSEEKLNYERRIRTLSSFVSKRQKGRKAAALGLEAMRKNWNSRHLQKLTHR